MNSVWRSALWAGIFLLLFGACQQDEVGPQDAKQVSAASAKDNHNALAITEDVMNITDAAMASKGFFGGRIEGGGHGHNDGDDDHGDNDDGDDDRDQCRPSISGTFNIDRTHQDSLIFTGSLIIDYGDGATCDSAHVRKGKIIDEFRMVVSFGDSITFSSTETITFEGFFKDSTQLDGKFTITSSTGNPTTVEAQDAVLTYPDGTTFSWEGTLSYTYEKHGNRHCKGKLMKVTGSISGTTREGFDFTAEITEEIVLRRCNHQQFAPISGVVEITVAGVTSTIDYGDGECDKKYTVTTAGVSVEHRI